VSAILSHLNKLVAGNIERLCSARWGGLSLHLLLALTVENENIQNYAWAPSVAVIKQRTMLHSRAYPRAVRDRTTILSLRLISIYVCLFLEPRPHVERVYADAKQVRWNKAKL
jgi:hypothetical protein